MIPKLIHYIWFGGTPLPDDAVRCINSWKKYCPDYRIQEWNEKNFDVNAVEYIQEAYKAKKWAFASDYARLSVLVQYGGIYMDTDVEIIKPLDEFLDKSAFLGFETPGSVSTGIMGCEKGHSFFKQLLEEYNRIHFEDRSGNYDLTTNVTRITKACSAAGLLLNNTLQEISNFTVFPIDYFCPLSHETGKLYVTKNTHVIHWFVGSWKSENELNVHKRAIELKNKYPGLPGKVASNIYEGSFKVRESISEGGWRALVARVKRYIKRKMI